MRIDIKGFRQPIQPPSSLPPSLSLSLSIQFNLPGMCTPMQTLSSLIWPEFNRNYKICHFIASDRFASSDTSTDIYTINSSEHLIEKLYSEQDLFGKNIQQGNCMSQLRSTKTKLRMEIPPQMIDSNRNRRSEFSGAFVTLAANAHYSKLNSIYLWTNDQIYELYVLSPKCEFRNSEM